MICELKALIWLSSSSCFLYFRHANQAEWEVFYCYVLILLNYLINFIKNTEYFLIIYSLTKLGVNKLKRSLWLGRIKKEFKRVNHIFNPIIVNILVIFTWSIVLIKVIWVFLSCKRVLFNFRYQRKLWITFYPLFINYSLENEVFIKSWVH